MKERIFSEMNTPDGYFVLEDHSISNPDAGLVAITSGYGSENDPFNLVAGQKLLDTSIIFYHYSESRNTPIWFVFNSYKVQIDAKNQNEPAKMVDLPEWDHYTARNMEEVVSSIFQDKELK